jgi:hypothetical protein
LVGLVRHRRCAISGDSRSTQTGWRPDCAAADDAADLLATETDPELLARWHAAASIAGRSATIASSPASNHDRTNLKPGKRGPKPVDADSP